MPQSRQRLDEVSLNNLGKINSHSELRKQLKATQGVDLGNPNKGEGGGNYRVHHDATITDGKGGKKSFSPARPLKTVHVGGAKNDEIKAKTTADQIKQAVIDSGRVNKTKEGVKRRKAEMRDNLAAKQKRRAAPFPAKADGTTPGKRTFEGWLQDCHNQLNESW